jgi:Tol biopolymer transport system component
VPNDTNGHPDVFVRDLSRRTTERVSVSSQEQEGWSFSVEPSVSAKGRFVAFSSGSGNLTPDRSRYGGVYVRDRLRGVTRLVSRGNHGQVAGLGAAAPSISANGRFVAFTSHSANLVARDTNRVTDVFVRDRKCGTTQRVSVGPHGLQANDWSQDPFLSADGRRVLFTSTATNWLPTQSGKVLGNWLPGNPTWNVFVHNIARATTRWVSVALGHHVPSLPSQAGELSGDGRVLTFASDARHLVPEDTNHTTDVFTRSR